MWTDDIFYFNTVHVLLMGAFISFIAAFAISLLVAVARAGRADKPAGWLSVVLPEAPFALASVLAGVAWTWRWVWVGHIPLQNLYEVFLTVLMVYWPVSLFSRRLLSPTNAPLQALFAALHAAVAASLAVPVAFEISNKFGPMPQHLPPALQHWLFAPHVGVYMIAYAVLWMAAIHGIVLLFLPRRKETPDQREKKNKPVLPTQRELTEAGIYRIMLFGFPLLTLGLVLGCVWGKIAWGDWWNWDPKEMWALAGWLLFLGFFHFRYLYKERLARINALWVIVGGVSLLLTLLWANISEFFKGLHSYA